jgi:hypothetical protein
MTEKDSSNNTKKDSNKKDALSSEANEYEQKKLEVKKILAAILKDKSNEPLNKIRNIM